MSKDFDIEIIDKKKKKKTINKEKFTEKSPIDSVSVMSPRMIS